VRVVESIELFYQEGSSDKVYNAAIVEDGSGYTVEVEWGRRGANLSTGTKAKQVTLEKAKKAYDKVVREKTSKGYEAITGDVAPAEIAPPIGEGSGSKSGKGGRRKLGQKAQLLESIEEEDVDAHIADPDLVGQQKLDGMRVLAHAGEGVSLTNRNGEITEGDAAVEKAIQKLGVQAILDGELVTGEGGRNFWIFDLLEVDGDDLRGLGYLERYDRLRELVARPGLLRVVPTARTAEEKRRLYDRLKEERAEGMVFKRGAAPYTEGRSSAQVKCKFVKSADVFLLENAGNAYRMAVFDGRSIRDVGKVFAGTTNTSRKQIDEALAAGERPVVEVRYLYATDAQILYQPVFQRFRTDKSEQECSLEQLVGTCRDVIAI
jgi:bifunctional non-homologous end joining protein LigD